MENWKNYKISYVNKNMSAVSKTVKDIWCEDFYSIFDIVCNYLPSEIFSPASGGRQNVRSVKEDTSAHGMRRLNP